MPAFIDLTGQTFGRLEVKEKIANINRRTAWRCQCVCGGFKETTGDALQAGKTRSCGCLWDETMIKHGGYLDPTYTVWRNMNARCNNPKNPKYSRYGGRGIKVVERWRSYATFIADMGPRPEGLCLERIDNDGNYDPSNCEWATYTQENNNTSRNKLITLGSVTKTAAEWCELTGLNHRTLASRLSSSMSVEMALTLPPPPGMLRDIPKPKVHSKLTHNGQTFTIKDWSKLTGINSATIISRIARRWEPERALTKPSKPTASPAPQD
jgi:hypothetical protein